MTNKPTEELQINLQPRGVFLITLVEDGKTVHVKGRFSMMALDRFCQQQGINNFLELIGKITLGMSITDYARLVVCAIQDYYREDIAQCKWTEADVTDRIFDIEGFGSEKLMSLFRHAIGRVTDVVGDTTGDTKKKGRMKASAKS